MKTILDGRDNRMPAHEHILNPEQIKVLTAWVWGLSNKPGDTATTAAPVAANTATPAVANPAANAVAQ